jgi:hypothetical protein
MRTTCVVDHDASVTQKLRKRYFGHRNNSHDSKKDSTQCISTLRLVAGKGGEACMSFLSILTQRRLDASHASTYSQM